MKEVPSDEWLRTYLQGEALSIYKAWDWTDAIWSVFSYFSWEEYEDHVSVFFVKTTESVRESALVGGRLLVLGDSSGVPIPFEWGG